MSLIRGTLNKPCTGMGKLGVQSLIALLDIRIQDLPVLTPPQQWVDNSTIKEGDDPLSHLLDEIPIISGNSSGNSSGNCSDGTDDRHRSMESLCSGCTGPGAGGFLYLRAATK